MLQNLATEKHGKPKLVHRLDRDTSGVLLLARTALAATKLTESFRRRTTQKIYWALVTGIPKPEKGRVNAPLIKQDEIMIVDEDGNDEAKSAITIYQTLESAKKLAAFVALWPITGRTHQLRVHCAHLGCPILGDPRYGGGAGTLHLLARAIALPLDPPLAATAPPPPHMRAALLACGWPGA
jgi:RluA family pseudouridine synthase